MRHKNENLSELTTGLHAEIGSVLKQNKFAQSLDTI